MSTANATFPRDANRVPITQNGVVVTKSLTLVGNNNTFNVPLFTVIGTVEIIALYGVVTTAIGANHTAAAWRVNDQAGQTYLTAVGGPTLSSLTAGTLIVKKDVVSAAAVLLSNATRIVSEPTTLETMYFSPVVVGKKTGALTQIEYHYATTDTPTTGVINFYVGFIPLTDDGDLIPV